MYDIIKNKISVLDLLVFFNGIYDIICATCIISHIHQLSYIANIHQTIFIPNQNYQMVNRLLGYWIMTYGIVRISIYKRNKVINTLISATYFIEVIYYTNEDILYGTVIKWKVAWISFSSILLGILVLFRET